MNVFWRSILIFVLLAAQSLRLTIPAASAKPPGRSITEPQGGSLFFSAPETREFPTIRFQFDAYDPQGRFLANLKADDIRVVEDGREITIDHIEKVSSGVQVVVALNLSPALGKKVDGPSEFERVQNALAEWANEQPDPRTGDFSLSTPTGLSLLRSRDPGEWADSIRGYQPDLARLQPSMGSLAEALDLTGEPLNSPFIKRAILYITPPLSAQHLAAIPDLASRARQTGARVDVWLMASQESGEIGAGHPLQELADVTGGAFHRIVPGAPLPDPETTFEPLRSTYQASYRSGIQKSGVHRLGLLVERGGLSLESSEHTFDITVQPPNPIFLSPPSRIERSWNASVKTKTLMLTPEEVQLQILIEFPDQHPRALAATRLYVDDQLVDENSSEPFDRFTWPVSQVAQSGKHELRVTAVDQLGLEGASLDIPVEVMVQQPARASLFDHITEEGLIAISAVIVSGGVLTLVLVLTSRQRQGRKRQPIDRQRMKDPVTQPVAIRQDDTQPRKRRDNGAGNGKGNGRSGQAKTAWAASAWPVTGWLKSNGQNAPARLVSLDENQQPVTGGALPLARQEITFGSDPLRATQLLESPTVDGLHARLYRNTEGAFILTDQNSVAGTWVNYAPVSSGGAQLEHGDLIHIGQVTFRFELTDPKQAHTPAIHVLNIER